jgi:uncharacterized protein YcbX
MHVSGLFLYPIKSGARLAVDAWDLDERGLVHDREYMVVDAEGVFLTQREVPRLALVGARLGEPLQVTTPLGAAVVTPGSHRDITVWNYSGAALDCGDEVAALLSTFLEREVRLVTTGTRFERRADDPRSALGFADGYPLLLIGQASLDDLNTRLPSPLPMDRFRPNVVVSGAEPYEEDEWLHVDLGDVPVDVVKPCLRCAITRVDQGTGVRGDGEPLRTLGTFRKVKGGVQFGQNLVHTGLGTLRVGDPVRVRARRS